MSLPQQQEAETGQQEAAPAPRKPPVIRMDRSRDHATVHGDRLHDDPDREVFFVQDGLPFDAHGKLVINHHSILNEERLQKKVEVLLLKALKRQQASPGDVDPEDAEEIEENLDDTFAPADDDDEEGKPPINLSDWAAGHAQHPWQDISNAIASRYATRIMNKKGALELLVRERVVTVGQLSKSNRRILEQD